MEPLGCDSRPSGLLSFITTLLDSHQSMAQVVHLTTNREENEEEKEGKGREINYSMIQQAKSDHLSVAIFSWRWYQHYYYYYQFQENLSNNISSDHYSYNLLSACQGPGAAPSASQDLAQGHGECSRRPISSSLRLRLGTWKPPREPCGTEPSR